MKTNNFLKTILITLIIIAISIISFYGIYVEDKNTVKNIMPEYNLGKDLKGFRRVELEVKTAEGEEEQNVELNLEDYKKSKEILEKRLKQMDLRDYTISQDANTGKIVVELPENDNTDTIVYELMSQGKFEIVDADTSEVLMDNNDLKEVTAGYGTTSDGYTSIFVNFEFNKEGTEKFKNITNTYIETTVESTDTTEETNNVEENTEEATSEEDDKEEEATTKEITIKIDDEELLTTHFSEEISNGLLQLSFGSNANLSTEELEERLIEANNMAILLNNGKLPVEYELAQNRYFITDITLEEINILIYASVAILLLGIVYIFVRFKMTGVKAVISLIGYIAVLLISVRIFNAELSIAGIFNILLSVVLNFVVLVNILSTNKENDNMRNAIIETIKKYTLMFVPAAIIAVVLTVTNIAGGTVLFWGLVINILYNLTVTRLLLTVNNK